MSQQEIEKLSRLIKALDLKISKKLTTISNDVTAVKKDVALIKADVDSIKKDVDSIDKVIRFREQAGNLDGLKKPKLAKA